MHKKNIFDLFNELNPPASDPAAGDIVKAVDVNTEIVTADPVKTETVAADPAGKSESIIDTADKKEIAEKAEGSEDNGS